MRKETIFLIATIMIIAAIIFAIYSVRGNGNYDDKTMQCIADKSIVVVSPTCSACAKQKLILGDYLSYFDIRAIQESPELIAQYNITKIPTWIINGQRYEGVYSISSLKELTGC